MKSFLLLPAAVLLCSATIQAATVANWTERTGQTPVSNLTTASPTLGDGTALSADAMSISAAIPTLNLAVGDKVTLSGSATFSGIVSLPNQFRFGLYDTNGSSNTNDWLGYFAGHGSLTTGALVWERNDNTANETAWYASTAGGSATGIATATAPGVAFDANTYNFLLTLELTAGGMQINSSIIRSSDSQQFGLNSYLDTTPSTTTYDRVGFLIGNSLNADQVQFSSIDVTVVPWVPDTTGPVLVTTTPTDGASLVTTTSNLIASFDENIALGATGSVTIRNLTTPSDTVISLPGPDPEGTLAVSGMDLFINPAVDLAAGDEYAIEISAGTVIDSVGNPYGGILATDDPNWSFTTDPNVPVNPGDRLFGIEFNRNSSLGSPSQSHFRIISGSITQGENAISYTKQVGSMQVTVSRPDATAFEFRGANGDSSRAIPGGDTSLSFLVSDFIATRKGAIDIGITGLPAGDYVFQSWHLDSITSATLGFSQGSTTTSPNFIEARLGGVVQGTIQPTALGSAGLGTTFIDDSQIPALAFAFTHDGSSPLIIELRSTVPNGSGDNHLLMNGFELFQAAP